MMFGRERTVAALLRVYLLENGCLGLEVRKQRREAQIVLIIGIWVNFSSPSQVYFTFPNTLLPAWHQKGRVKGICVVSVD